MDIVLATGAFVIGPNERLEIGGPNPLTFWAKEGVQSFDGQNVVLPINGAGATLNAGVSDGEGTLRIRSIRWQRVHVDSVGTMSVVYTLTERPI